MMGRGFIISMIKNPGQKAEKLLALNQKIGVKITFYETKLAVLKQKRAENAMIARDLLSEERVQRKYKVE